MTSIDAARQRLAEISARAEATPEWTGGPDWAFHALNDRARLVVALTAVLDKHTEWHACENADGKGFTDYAANDDCLEPCPTYLAVAAALGKQP